ncbi:uncharacterized protein LOC113514524 [Galleria mellonella]|uniref:Uncharacterized protein LOC113514524 n=1 Tax=Galleria mellonella TaxID=7137 RepID=A0A6J3BUK2_GALME|nr:uncharacterized protein LOC113514524 [Galleria mellonella]
MASIDVEQFIQEIKSRPVLYDKSLPEYTNRRRKEDMWLEICSKIIPDWESIDEREKDIICRDIQLKWKHIRDNFRREFQIQKKIKCGLATQTKKIYRYYTQLQFLKATINYSDSITSGDRASQRETDEEGSDSTPSTSKKSKTIMYQRKNKKIQNLKRNKKGKITSIEKHEQVLKPKPKNSSDQEEADDEDRSFCISLVKSLKKMSDEAKLNAKIDILNVIRRFSFPQSDFYQVYTDPLPYEPPKQSSHNITLQKRLKVEYSPENSQDESPHCGRKKKIRNARHLQLSSPDSVASGSVNNTSSSSNSNSPSSFRKCHSPTGTNSEDHNT